SGPGPFRPGPPAPNPPPRRPVGAPPLARIRLHAARSAACSPVLLPSGRAGAPGITLGARRGRKGSGSDGAQAGLDDSWPDPLPGRGAPGDGGADDQPPGPRVRGPAERGGGGSAARVPDVARPAHL